MNNNENQPNNNQNQNNNNNQNNNQNQNNQPKQPVKTVVVNNDNNRNFMRIAGIVVIIVVLLALASNGKWMKKGANDSDKNVSTLSDMPEGCKPGYLFSETTGKPCPTDDATASAFTAVNKKTSKASTSSSYDQVLKAYAGKTILVDGSCAATPSTASFDAGTRVLVANNSTKSLALALGTKSATLAPYHYFTTTLNTVGDVSAYCNGTAVSAISVK